MLRSYTLMICIWSCLAFGDDKQTLPQNSDKRLVEVTFALDDKPPTQDFHEVATLWISEKNRGSDDDIYDWAVHGGFGPDADAQEEAAKCKKLLNTIEQAKTLPKSPNQIVTVSCLDGDKKLVKKFPTDQVPSEVHEMLLIMGFPESSFKRLIFIKK